MKTQQTRKLSAVLAATFMVAAVSKPVAAATGLHDYTFIPIAFRGDPAPGGGTFVVDFEPSAINNRGEFAFTADVVTPGDEGIFLSQPGPLTQLVRFGQPAPGGGAFDATEMGNIGLNDAGDIAFAFSLQPLTYFFYEGGYAIGALGGIYRQSHSAHGIAPVALPGDGVPGGGTFVGMSWDLSLNNHGSIAFSGVVGTTANPAQGVFLAENNGKLTSVANPGTPGPEGSAWAYAGEPRLNNRGDVAFFGRTASAPFGVYSIYLMDAESGGIETIAAPGGAAPGGGTIASCLSPRINDTGDVAFMAELTLEPPTVPFFTGTIYLQTHQGMQRIAGPGDAMPGGGHIAQIPLVNWFLGLNNPGDVAFSATLDTSDVLPTGDEGLYVYSQGSIHLIARSGTMIPGLGTIYSLETGQIAPPGIPPPPAGFPNCGSQINDRGQTFFGCSLTDGRVVLLLATPSGNDE
jgi:hypothetical protein